MKNKEFVKIKALEALTWLSQSEELLYNFLAQNGGDMSEVFKRADDPEFLIFVLDYCLSSDDIAIACAEALSVKPEELIKIRSLLPGGHHYNWI